LYFYLFEDASEVWQFKLLSFKIIDICTLIKVANYRFAINPHWLTQLAMVGVVLSAYWLVQTCADLPGDPDRNGGPGSVACFVCIVTVIPYALLAVFRDVYDDGIPCWK
jgi:hypothetical protein